MQDFNFDIHNGVLKKYGGYYSEIIIPEGVTHIAENAFLQCSFLEKVTFPKSLVEIGKSAFFGCKNLTSLQFENGSLEIQEDAFQYCVQLKKITLPEEITLLRRGVFSYCSNLEEVIFPETLERIETSTFFYCKNFTEVHLPDSLQSINEDAFDYAVKRKFTYQGIVFWNLLLENNYRREILPSYCVKVIREHSFFNDYVQVPFPMNIAIASQMLLKYPENQKLLKYMEEDFTWEITRYLPECYEIEIIKVILENPTIISKDLIDELIQEANKKRNYELQVLLTEYKRKNYGFETIEEKTRKLLLD